MDTQGTSAKPSSRTWVYLLIGAIVVVGVVLIIMKQTGGQQSGKAGVRPVASSCTDSDGGQVTTVQGHTDFRGRAYVDGCVDANRVRETFCLEGKLKMSTLSCDAGYQCVSGACIPTTYTLTIENDPSILRVTSNDSSFVSSEVGYRPKIDCGTDCSESYIAGTVVTLAVGQVDPGFDFNGYTGDCTGGSCILTMDSHKTVGVTYRPSTTEPEATSEPPSTEPAPPPTSVCLDSQYTCEPFPLCTSNLPYVTRNCTINSGVSCALPASVTTMGCMIPAPSETPPPPPSGTSTPTPPTSVCLDSQYTCGPFTVCEPGVGSVTRSCTINAGSIVSCTIPTSATIMRCTTPAPPSEGSATTTPPSTPQPSN